MNKDAGLGAAAIKFREARAKRERNRAAPRSKDEMIRDDRGRLIPNLANVLAMLRSNHLVA